MQGNPCLDPLALRLHFSMGLPFLCVVFETNIIIAINYKYERHFGLQNCN